jgi:ADP-dependent NAD(P)H-hydrate dehydratase / NAD(P)H-hydrate epimerase
MRQADRRAVEDVPESELIRRAGYATARVALSMLGSAYGSRVIVVAGKGNNGADGRVAANVLRRRGAAVEVIEAERAPDTLVECDLYIDAAYGTGFRGAYGAPATSAPILAVDIPSGVAGDSGEASANAVRATRTVTFAALKPGLLQGAGADLTGPIEMADIGIDITDFVAAEITDDDVAVRLPTRARVGHKWDAAVAVVAGSPGMEGAANLSARGASHAGAGMVRLAVPGEGQRPGPWPLEAVRLEATSADWADEVRGTLLRCRVLVIGPGLGRTNETVAQVRQLMATVDVPIVADADALFALGSAKEAAQVVAAVDRPVVLTPHDGEYQRMAGQAPGPDRLGAAQRLADSTGATVLLKGPLTAVAAPGGSVPVLLATAGSARLATAGTGDVLSGIIGAFIARGLDVQWAAALAAHVHGRAAGLGPAEGLVAPDLPDLVASWLTTMRNKGA